ncbi:type II secretion system F family protein [Streptomyces sp. O3]
MTANLAPLALGATLLCAVFAIAGLHVYLSGKAQRQALEDRLAAAGPRLPGRHRRFTAVDRRVRKTRVGRRIQLKLAATGLDLTPGEFLVYMLASVVALWVIAANVLAPFFGPIAGLVGLWGANTFLNWQRQKRIEAFINQLPDLARLLANGASAGLALRTSLSMAADELERPAGDELATASAQLAMGRSLDDALGELAERLPSRELAVLVTTLILSNKAGGTLVASLRNLTQTLEERKETRREVRTMLSEVNATAFTIPCLGVGAMLMLNTMNDGALSRVTGTTLGQALILISLGLYAAGFVVIRRLGKIDV